MENLRGGMPNRLRNNMLKDCTLSKPTALHISVTGQSVDCNSCLAFSSLQCIKYWCGVMEYTFLNIRKKCWLFILATPAICSSEMRELQLASVHSFAKEILL